MCLDPRIACEATQVATDAFHVLQRACQGGYRVAQCSYVLLCQHLRMAGASIYCSIVAGQSLQKGHTLPSFVQQHFTQKPRAATAASNIANCNLELAFKTTTGRVRLLGAASFYLHPMTERALSLRPPRAPSPRAGACVYPQPHQRPT